MVLLSLLSLLERGNQRAPNFTTRATWEAHSEHLREVNATLGDQTINDKVKQWYEDKNQKGI